MKHAKTLFAITALSAALSSALWPGMASAAPAATVSAETWFGAEPASSGPALSRAEVQADLALWNRAGLNVYRESDVNHWDADYQQRLAQYQRMRSGPEYLAEVQRLGGSVKAAEGQGSGRVPG
ncbi:MULTISPECIES: DUF4148 domain-containing protein [Delftia]|uniref:DUF4148 domain-containing protein n=2 Tax=Delftia TaxID=80865 RepID=A0AAX3SK82_9BURK|nr:MULTISPECIES: DUF4148 domain-containing protein [Delftia]KAA9155822.1 DUF4148 domain-containing protein [Delftia sp. BR1]KEH11073.1 hypothetical protein GY15_29955 [Delftia sp. 670]AOV04601.1 hypothetical protein BI380_26365 [Delftia tsuruhatensis]EPD35977.1 hypothetical protein HMPREF9702_05700 [Delftia acidovorans CCUG 15835]MCX7504887.1 DUF4148 domain-containing protein [Delftia tsuruhatensis]